MGKIVFVGAGSMAEAIIAGILTNEVMLPADVYVMNKSDDERLAHMQKTYGVSIVCQDRVALQNAELIVLATKPKDITQAMDDIADYINDDAAVLSVIAGVSMDTIEKGLGDRPIARSMPNTSATIGKSASGVSMNKSVDAIMRNRIFELLSSIGVVKEVDEDELHIVTALSGSGPAYVYYMVEALEEAAIANGLSNEVARELIIQTFEGAAAMLRQTGEEPEQLRKNVTSPGGTTEAGLKALEARLFKETIYDCLLSAEKRSRELGALSQ
ncbi:pyrroline-5-carboxylate reductase [Sporosarcina luteola]|uniref:pyrroline-5-carboxylate reductase n=1 Tax=Sporosarcina luteola TaxID=582850 RepID=UPI00203F07ED|nr:pyrroline-5-carboxylate reductase [Sporosarcina luteola]MCM3743283.1 pyrroline-5-carboxylate reductase [Sporosarcina luteola]